jgi:predicted nucleic acid-binding protein
VTIYVDSSAFLKRYLDEPDADRFEEVLGSDLDWICGRHTAIEVRRTLVRHLLDPHLGVARTQFEADWGDTRVIELDRAVCEIAVEIAEVTRARTLDALHLAAAQWAGGGALTFVTADLRQAQAARSLGWMVLGA